MFREAPLRAPRSLVEPHRPPFDRRPIRPSRDLLYAWCPASLSVPFRVPSRALSSLFTTRRFATSARQLLSKRVVRLGGWIAFPRDPTGAGPARRSLVRGARRARPPPLVPHGTASASPCSSGTAGWRRFRAPSVLRWDYRARVGRVPAATPVHSTDVCCSQILFSKNFQGCCPSLDTRLSASSHALGELPVHAVGARFGEPARGPERCLLR